MNSGGEIYYEESGPKVIYHHSLHPAHIGYHGGDGSGAFQIKTDSINDDHAPL